MKSCIKNKTYLWLLLLALSFLGGARGSFIPDFSKCFGGGDKSDGTNVQFTQDIKDSRVKTCSFECCNGNTRMPVSDRDILWHEFANMYEKSNPGEEGMDLFKKISQAHNATSNEVRSLHEEIGALKSENKRIKELAKKKGKGGDIEMIEMKDEENNRLNKRLLEAKNDSAILKGKNEQLEKRLRKLKLFEIMMDWDREAGSDFSCGVTNPENTLGVEDEFFLDVVIGIKLKNGKNFYFNIEEYDTFRRMWEIMHKLEYL